MIKLQVNNQLYNLDVDDEMPLLWVLRERLGLTGAKYGCGKGLCGCCTVLVDDQPLLSCQIPVSALSGKAIVTIEGLASAHALHPVQQAWLDENVPECGYCQPGQILTAVALLKKNSLPNDAAIDAAMSGVLCRCGTYQRIRKAIKRASAKQGDGHAT